MKQRISHFITKSIEVNNKTRPTPKKIVLDQGNNPSNGNINNRQHLKKKLNLADTFGIFKTPKVKIQSTKPHKKVDSQRNKIKNSINTEARYAATPKGPSLENFCKNLKQEAGRLKVVAEGTWRQRKQPEHQQLEKLYGEIIFKPWTSQGGN